MNTAKQIIKIIVLSVVVVLTIHAITADTFASTCVQINSNLSYDQTDSTTDGPVMMLQKYLQLNGYFSSNPNGHFGLVTLASVKKIQAGNNLAATGYVGPLTRALISQKTCSTVSTVATSHIPTPQSLTPSEPVTPTIVSNTIPCVLIVSVGVGSLIPLNVIHGTLASLHVINPLLQFEALKFS